MKKNILWFLLGGVSTIAVILLFNWQVNRPSNAVREFSPEVQQFMLSLMPWLENARGVSVGPFKVVVPNDSSGSQEAIIQPQDNGFPQIFLMGEDEASIVGAEGKIMSVRFKPETGELQSFNVSPDSSLSTTFFDHDFDGEYDLKYLSKTEDKPFSIHVRYQSEWLPIVFQDKKKYVELDGQLKEVTISNSSWGFVD